MRAVNRTVSKRLLPSAVVVRRTRGSAGLDAAGFGSAVLGLKPKPKRPHNFPHNTNKGLFKTAHKKLKFILLVGL